MSFKLKCLDFISKVTWRLLCLRYRFEIKGLQKIDEKQLPRSGGVIFLANHPALIDSLITYSLLWAKFHPRPVATEYVYETGGVNALMQAMRGVPVPDFDIQGSSLKRRRAEESFRKIRQGLREGDSFVINPAGRLKSTGIEYVGGASWAHKLVQEVSEANIVLVRIDGLWGSLFSRAATGKTPALGASFKRAAIVLLKNLIFFAPKRNIKVEFELVNDDSLREKERRQFNSYLEDWFNKYQKTQVDAQGNYGMAEALSLVSYSCLKEEFLEVRPTFVQEDSEKIDVAQIPKTVQEAVLNELSRLTKRPAKKIQPEMDLVKHLGLDSLDGAELILFLDDKFEIRGVQPHDLTTVAKLMALAAAQVDLGLPEDDESDLDQLVSKWNEKWKRPSPQPPEGRTLQEAFLRVCDRMGDAVACADRLAGVLTYRQMKMRVLLLADEIKRMPGNRIGIMLPASVAVNVAILATLLAGKTPVMINWTVGSRHLKSCVDSAGLHVILTSRRFTDQLEGVDLTSVASLLVMMEDFKRRIGLSQKLRALLESYRKATAILEDRGSWYADPHGASVVLFTSGTESLPKGVPLSHRNILSNHRGVFAVVNLHASDVIYGMLPPFHSFGFTITGLLPLLSGLKVVYSPNPTDSIRLARGIDRWGITIVCSAPTFLKGILHSATPEQLKSVRLFVSGAEKAPADLFEQIVSLGAGKQLLEGYGITECSPVLTINRPDRPHKGVGQPMPNVQLKIIHPETHEVLKTGEIGLIIARGTSVFSGYLDALAKSPFIELEGKSWYNTGDLGHLDAEQNLTISGRLKRFVKIGGEMVSLVSVEEVLASHYAGNSDDLQGPVLAVVPLEIDGQKTQMHLFTTLDMNLEEVNALLSSSGMSNLVKISAIHGLPMIPLTGTGKIAYRELTQTAQNYLKDSQN
jgi:acyl-CoA synthetase (AMP-forming)/AMP-acid ligase II/1-acyl-sn-glycerol-3-phosphate acyltransferase/acyl carrier protein